MKTLAEIADNQRIQNAFLDRFKATPEERQKPKAFVIGKIKSYIREMVNAYETDEAIRIAREQISTEDVI